MSERKTAEIKFRIEPSVKARWQAAADAIEDGLSEFIRGCVEQSIMHGEYWAQKNQSLDGTKLLGNAIDAITEIDPAESQFATVLMPGMPEGELWVVDMDKVSLERTQPLAIIKNVTDASPANPAMLPCDCGRGGICPGCSRSEAKKQGVNLDAGSVPKSWMFEGRNG